MIEKCEALQEGLKKLLPLAKEIQKQSGTHNLDVMHIENAIQSVALRIGYLKKQAATQPPAPVAPAKKTKAQSEAEADATKQREEYKALLREEYGTGTIEQLEQVKTDAESLLATKPEDDDAKCIIEVCDELIAAAKKTTP